MSSTTHFPAAHATVPRASVVGITYLSVASNVVPGLVYAINCSGKFGSDSTKGASVDVYITRQSGLEATAPVRQDIFDMEAKHIFENIKYYTLVYAHLLHRPAQSIFMHTHFKPLHVPLSFEWEMVPKSRM